MTRVIYPSYGLSGNTKNNGISGTTNAGKNGLDVNIIGGADLDVELSSASNSSISYIGKASGTNADFAVAYTAAATITLSSLPTGVTAFTADDITTVVQIATDGSVTATYSRDDVAFTMAGNVLTVTGAAFVATDTFIVYTNVARQTAGNAYDSTTD